MKIRNKTVRLVALLLALVTTLGLLTSCLFGDPSADSEYMTEQEIKDLVSGMIHGDTTIENVNEYNVSINAGAEGNLVAAAKGVLSVVSITCGFTVVEYDIFGREYTQQASSAGAGVIYKLDKTSGDAYIITNYHVVYNASSPNGGISQKIVVRLYGMEDTKYDIPATFIGGSMMQDLAVLKVSGSRVLLESNAMAVSVADSDEVSILDTAIAIGNPAAAGISATVGCINVDSEYVNITAADDKTSVLLQLFRIDTAVNGGNSGGGLFNSKGELIGIVNAKIVSTNIDNIAYAIPSNVAISVVDNIIYHCDGKDAKNPYKYSMGIEMSIDGQYTEYDMETGKVNKREVISVGSITAGSIASELFVVGDVIKTITVNGKATTINRMFQVYNLMYTVRSGDTVTVTMTRAGQDVELVVPVERMTLNKVQ